MSDTQRDREERQHVIEVLKSWDGYFIGYTSDEVQEALKYAIASIKTDLKYDLMYEGALEQEPCEDVISRKSIKRKLQEHHDFFVNTYGGFINLPQNDKSRVDEITNCIAMVVNEPSITPQEPLGKYFCASA